MRIKHKLKRLALATSCGLLVAGAGAVAQNLNNDGGTINNIGDIVFCTTAGEFQSGGVGAALNGDGTVTFEGIDNRFTDQNGVFADALTPGETAGTRIPYEVIWSAAAGTQTVQGRYYENLTVEDASLKTISDGIFVSEVYTAGGNDRTYNGTFTYDGSLAQDIFAETGMAAGTNRYNNLQLGEAGTKTLQAGDVTTIDGDLVMLASNTGGFEVLGGLTIGDEVTQDAAAPLLIDATGGGAADGQFTTGTGNGAFAGTVTIDNGGLLDIAGAGATNEFSNTVDVTDGDFFVRDGTGDVTVSGTMTLANLATATINLEQNATVVVTGSLTNNHAAGVNANFDDASTVEFSGAANQVVMQTVASNPYGNLSTDNGVKDAGGDVYMSNNLDVGVTDGAGGNLDMGANTLYMTDPNATADYDATNYTEVVGAMRRSVDAGVVGPYTFNNAESQVTFTNNPYTGYFEMNVQPATAPNNYDASTDVNRKITLDFDDDTWTATIRAGWKDGEQGAGWGGASPVTTEDQLRFFEADGTNEQKVATGNAPSRDNASQLRYVQLAGIDATAVAMPGNAISEFYATNDLLLRGGPTTFYAIADGRWSNPGTWDEGLEPHEYDNVIIPNGFTVHVGYRRDGIDGLIVGPNGGQIEEGYSQGGDNTRDDALAVNVTVEDGGGLLVGYDAAGAADETDGTVTWQLATGGLLTNASGLGATTAPTEAVLATTQGDAIDYPGFINFGNIGSNLGHFQANSIDNTGYIANGGTLRVCD